MNRREFDLRPRTVLASLCLVALLELPCCRVARAQADVEVELQHVKRLYESGRWLELIGEADRSVQGLSQQLGGKVGPALNASLTFAVLKARFAAAAGDLAAAADAIKAAERIYSTRGFQQVVAAMRPADNAATERDDAPVRKYEALMLARNLWLIDARTEVALDRKDWDAAEKLVQYSFQVRRAAGGRSIMLGSRGDESGLLSPDMLLAVSTFEPSRLAAELYVGREQISRARSYLMDAEEEVSVALADAFPPGDERRPGVPEWPTDRRPPLPEQREAMATRARIAMLRGEIEAADGQSDKAEAAFDEAIERWRSAFDEDHPEALPALVGTARLAIARAEEATARRDFKTASTRAAKARRLLEVIERVAEPALAPDGSRVAEIKELSARLAALGSAAVDTAAIETAERAAREALRSISRYKTLGGAAVIRSDDAAAGGGSP